MDVQKYTDLTIDFQNLMSCIQCHEDSTNIPIILETLKTIIDLCSNEDCGKDAFREEGGIDFIVQLISTTDSTILLEHLLKTLALVIDENVHSQMHMAKKEFFDVLQVIIRTPTLPSSVLKNALLLASSVLFQNSLAQGLILENGFLQDLISVYENTAPSYMTSACTKSTVNVSSVDVWISANSSLCFAVNNPQNEKNQEACSVLFPLSLKLLESSSDYAISSGVSSFLSLCVANNVKNQEKFAEYDGLLVLKRCFQKQIESIELDMKEFNSVVAKYTLQSINNLTSIITAVASENDKNAAFLGKLGVLSLMLRLLIIGVPDEQLQTRIMLALAYCIDAHRSCKLYVLQCANFDSFLKMNFQRGAAELVSASKYLLQVCLNEEEKFPESDTNLLQDDRSCIFPSVSDKCSVASEDKAISQKLPARIKVQAKNPKQQNSSEQNGQLTPEKDENSSAIFKCKPVKDSHASKRWLQSLERTDKYLANKALKYSKDCKSNFSLQNSQVSEHHCKAKRVSGHFRNKSSKCAKKLHSESFIPCTSIKSYRNSKRENIILLNNAFQKNSNSFQQCKSPKFVETSSEHSSVSSLNAYSSSSVVLNHKEKLQKNESFCLDSMDNFEKKLLSPLKRLKTKHFQKPFTVDYDSYPEALKKRKRVLSKETNRVHTACDRPFGEKEVFSPLLKPMAEESKENTLPASSLMYDGSHESDLYHNDNFYEDISASQSSNFWKPGTSTKTRNRKEKIKQAADVSCYSKETGFCMNSRLEKSQSLLKNSRTLFNFRQTESSRDLGIENCSSEDKMIKKRRNKRKLLRNPAAGFELDSPDISTNLFQDSHSERYTQVIVIPGDSCEQHKLTASFEMLKVIPLEDAAID